MDLKILVLEDDNDLRLMLVDVLEDEGYEVCSASSGDEALQLCEQQQFDMLITDVRMPGADGLETLSRVRQTQPQLDSLVVSGYTGEAETLRALKLNVGGYLKKPFSLHELLTKVRELLSERQRQRHLLQVQDGLLNSLRWVACKYSELFLPEYLGAAESAAGLAKALGANARGCELASLLWWVEPDELIFQRDAVGLGSIQALLDKSGAGLEQQIVRWAVWNAKNPGQPFPEELDARLQMLIGSNSGASLNVPEPATGKQSLSHLLALAQEFELHQQLDSARSAYQKICLATEEHPVMRIEALLGLVRCDPDRSPAGGWYEHLQEAERLGRTLSPQTSAEARWSIAKILWSCGHSSRVDYLRRLQSDCLALRDQAGWARARLLGEGDLDAARELLLPKNFSVLQAEAEWAIPALLNLAQAIGPTTAWCRLASEFPSLVNDWLNSVQHPNRLVVRACLQENLHLLSQDFKQLLSPPVAEPEPGPSVALVTPKVYLRAKLFGDFELTVDGREVDDKLFKSQKNKFVLAYLLENRGRFVSEDTLTEEFWPNSSDGGKSSIYAACTSIRRALRQEKSQLEIIQRDSGRLRLDPELSLWLDTEELEQSLKSVDQPDWQIRQLKLYRAPYLQNCYQNWATVQRNHWEILMVGSYQKLASSILDRDPAQAAEIANLGLDIDPMSQDLHAARMQAFLKLSKPEMAIRQFQKCSNLLRIELGIEPTTELIELFHRSKLALP